MKNYGEVKTEYGKLLGEKLKGNINNIKELKRNDFLDKIKLHLYLFETDNGDLMITVNGDSGEITYNLKYIACTYENIQELNKIIDIIKVTTEEYFSKFEITKETLMNFMEELFNAIREEELFNAIREEQENE